MMIFKIWADFDDSRADFRLQNLCVSLGLSWSGLVSCVPWSAGTDFCIFSAIYWKCWNFHKMMEFPEISEKSKHFSKFSGFCVFQAIDPPKPLINDKEYWCFCNPVDFAEIIIFIKKAKICEKFIFLNFYGNSVKKWFFAKIGQKALRTPKKGWNCIGFTRPGASGPRRCGKLVFRSSLQENLQWFL